LFPHQWKNLEGTYQYLTQSFRTVKGQTKLIVGNQFKTKNKFFGILPYLPDVGNYDRTKLKTYLNSEKDQDIYLPDSYNSAKQIARVANLIPIADQLGETTTRDYLISRVKERLVNWLTYTSGEDYAFFYYDPNWNSLLPFNNSLEMILVLQIIISNLNILFILLQYFLCTTKIFYEIMGQW
jgi:hypothetical protein